MAKIFPYCEVDLDIEHDSAIESLDQGKLDLSRTPGVGEHVAIKSAMFEVARVIHRNIDEVGFDASVELKPVYG